MRLTGEVPVPVVAGGVVYPILAADISDAGFSFPKCGDDLVL